MNKNGLPVIGTMVLHSCIRAHKQSWALRLKGYDVHLFTERVVGGHGWKDYSACHLLDTGFFKYKQIDEEHIRETVRSMDNLIDIWHIHNEPDFIVRVVREATKKPIVYDIHDMVSMRQKSPFKDEEDALEACNAISVPSREYQTNIIKRVNKPCIEVLSCVPEVLFPKGRTKLQWDGIVYEGGVKGPDSDSSEQFHWRSWHPIFKEIVKMGIKVYMYPNSSGEDLSAYADIGVLNMGSLHFTGLLNNLTGYEAAIIGSPYPDPAFDGAMPNKLFDYIAAGVPMISMNAPTVKMFLEASGFGYNIESVEEVPKALEFFKEQKTRELIWDMRKYWSMDRQTHKLESLYKSLMEAK